MNPRDIEERVESRTRLMLRHTWLVTTAGILALAGVVAAVPLGVRGASSRDRPPAVKVTFPAVGSVTGRTEPVSRSGRSPWEGRAADAFFRSQRPATDLPFSVTSLFSCAVTLTVDAFTVPNCSL